MKTISLQLNKGPECGWLGPGELELIVSDGYRFQAVKIEHLDSRIDIANQLRTLADNIERDRMMGEGEDPQSPTLVIPYLGFGS